MRRIKTFREINEHDYEDYDYIRRRKDPEDYEPVKDRELEENDKLFTTLGMTGWMALLFKNPNARELWMLNLEDGAVEDLITDYLYGYDGEYEDIDPDACEDLATDIFTGRHDKRAKPEMGVGMEDWDAGCSLIKLDQALGEFILEDLISPAYRANPGMLASAAKANRMEKKVMVDAILRAFPGIDV